MKTKPKSNEKKGQWLNIVLAVVISAFITFMITSTICKNKLAEEEELLHKDFKGSQDERIASALEEEFNPDSENLEKLYASFRKHENDITKHSDTYNNVGLRMLDHSHNIEEGDSSIYVESEATFKNVSDVPIYMEFFDVAYQRDDAPSFSFQVAASNDEPAGIEIDIEGIDSIVYPEEEITLTYDAALEKNMAGEYGMSLYKFSHEYEYDVEYFIHTDDVDALDDE